MYDLTKVLVFLLVSFSLSIARGSWPWVIYSPTVYWSSLKRQVRHWDNKGNKMPLSLRSSPSSGIKTAGLQCALCFDEVWAWCWWNGVDGAGEGSNASPSPSSYETHDSKMTGLYSDGSLCNPFKCNSLQGEKYVFREAFKIMSHK